MPKHLSLFDSISKYLIAAVLIIVPLFPKFPLLKIPGSYVAIRFEDVLLVLLAIVLVAKIVPNIKSFLKDDIARAFIVFFGIGLVSLFVGSYLTQTVDFKVGIFHWARRIEYVIPFFAGLLLLKKEKVSDNINFYLKILLLVVGIAFVYGLGQMYLRFPVIITQNEEYSKGVALFWTPGSHINSTFAGHYDMSAFLVIVLPIFITLMFLIKDKISKAILFVVSGSGLWLLINSLSRTGQISYLIAVAVPLLLLRKFKALAAILLISLILIGGSSGLDQRFQRLIYVFTQKATFGRITGYAVPKFTVYAQESAIPTKRAVPTPTPAPVPVLEDRSASIRLNVEWPRAIRAFLKNPILGTGYSSIDLATDNDFLRILGETGILGLLAFFLIFFRIGQIFVKALPLSDKLPPIEKAFIYGLIGGVLGTFLSAIFIDLFEASKFATLFWLILGYGVYLLRNLEHVSKN